MDDIIEPKLILNPEICRRNIQIMVQRVKAWSGDFRPHFKTHQSATIGEWFKQEGIERITVSSFKMAQYFANHGWNDITIAITVTAKHAQLIDQLASKINLNIVLEDENNITELEQQLHNPVGVFIKVDTGYHRTGIDADNLSKLKQLLQLLKNSKKLIFIGFLTHAGHTYHVHGEDQMQKIVKPALDKLLVLKTFLKDEFPLMQLSWGDTPSCSVYNDFYGVDEFRPGNFVFYDYTQSEIGSCNLEDIAVCLAVPVLAVHPERNEVVVHGGAVHLSKDYLRKEDGSISYGKVIAMNGLQWNVDEIVGEVKSLSQEHGIISVEGDSIRNIKPGDQLGILPVHSCLTANLMKQFWCTDGNKIDMMP